jgi:Rrf2 family protein
MLGKKSVHATHALIVMASQAGARTITAAQLASHMALSVSYLESLLKVLRENGLVRSVRGPGGGYELGMPASQMSLWAVSRLFDAAPAPARPTGPDQIDLDLALGDAMQAHAQQLLSSVFIGDHVQSVLPIPTSSPPLKWGFGFKPLAPRWLPEAPNSVFQLSEFMAQTAPAWAA